MKLHQINEDDLVELERTIPLLQGCLMPELARNPDAAPRIRKLLGVAKRILSDVRWDYGPPTQVGDVKDEGDGESTSDEI